MASDGWMQWLLGVFSFLLLPWVMLRLEIIRRWIFQLEGLDAKWALKQSNGFRRRISLQTFLNSFLFLRRRKGFKHGHDLL